MLHHLIISIVLTNLFPGIRGPDAGRSQGPVLGGGSGPQRLSAGVHDTVPAAERY